MQVAVLRVRLEELEDEVKSKTSRLDELEKDRERILRDHTDSSGLHSQALDTQGMFIYFIIIKKLLTVKLMTGPMCAIGSQSKVRANASWLLFQVALPGCFFWF